MDALGNRGQLVSSLLEDLRKEFPNEVRDLLHKETRASIVPHACEEIWIDRQGNHHKIGDMARTHLAHTLALIVRAARKGAAWVLMPDGSLRTKIIASPRKHHFQDLFDFEAF